MTCQTKQKVIIKKLQDTALCIKYRCYQSLCQTGVKMCLRWDLFKHWTLFHNRIFPRETVAGQIRKILQISDPKPMKNMKGFSNIYVRLLKPKPFLSLTTECASI